MHIADFLVSEEIKRFRVKEDSVFDHDLFCKRFQTKREDVLIIFGDAGINFSGGMRDGLKKQFLEELSITLFCIHGNHEQRPGTIDTYKENGLLFNTEVCYY